MKENAYREKGKVGKALFAHRAHLVFVMGSLQVGATPVCCSALLLVGTYLMGGFEKSNMRWLATMFHFHFERDHVNDGFFIEYTIVFLSTVPSLHHSLED